MRILMALSMTVLVSAQSAVPRYEVKRVAAPITIDGKPDEPAWLAAPAVTLQFLWDSQTGAKQMTRSRTERELDRHRVLPSLTTQQQET